MSETTRHVADHGGGEVAIYAETGHSDEHGEATLSEVVRLRAPDQGDVDSMLRLHGWRRVGPWMRRDDMPEGHRLAMIEPGPVSASLQQLNRDQEIGDQRRSG